MNPTDANFTLNDLVLSRCQIEVLKSRERYDRGGFGKPGSKDAERRFVNFKCYLYRKYGVTK